MPPAVQAKTTAPQSAAPTELEDIRENMGAGRAMARAHNHSSVVRRPILSEIAEIANVL